MIKRTQTSQLLLAALLLASVTGGVFASEAVAPATSPATIAKVFTAETLYVCPMHAEVISADVEQPCPLCGMKLKAMSEEARAQLMELELNGCPMDPIVMSGVKPADCPVCGMKLSKIDPPVEEQTEERTVTPDGNHGGHDHNHGH